MKLQKNERMKGRQNLLFKKFVRVDSTSLSDESKNLFGAVLANKETYDAALTRFGNQSVKIFNQSFGGNKA